MLMTLPMKPVARTGKLKKKEPAGFEITFMLPNVELEQLLIV